MVAGDLDAVPDESGASEWRCVHRMYDGHPHSRYNDTWKRFIQIGIIAKIPSLYTLLLVWGLVGWGWRRIALDNAR